MPGLRRFSPLVASFFVVLLLGSGAVTAADPDIEIFGEGVAFYVAHGRPGSANFALGMAYDGRGTIPFEGCGWVIGRAEKEGGQVHVVGFLDGLSQLEFSFENFTLDKEGTQHGLARNVTVDGSIDHGGKPQYPRSFASIAGWGQANFFVDGDTYSDPAGPEKTFDLQASFFITPSGFRDNESQGILAKKGGFWKPGLGDAVTNPKNWEMHLRVESPNPGSGRPYVVVLRPPGDLPDGTIAQQTEHQANYRFQNLRYGGVAEITVSSSSSAPDSFGNEVRFRIVSPALKALANLTVHPSLNHPETATLKLPLTMFQNYTIEATGKLVAGKYDITVRQVPPERLDFNLWWEDLVFGRPGLIENNDCEDQMGGNTFVTPGLAARPDPPAFPLELVAVGIVATLVALLFAVKLISDQMAGAEFLKTFRKR